MTRKKLILFLTVTLLMLAAMPAFAYNAWSSCRGHVRWNNNDVTWRPSLTAFPSGSGWYNAIDAARVAWNSYTPGGNYRINYTWDTNNVVTLNDSRNSITMPAYWDPSWGKENPWDPEPLAVTFPRRSTCYAWPGPDANWVEMDIAFNKNYSWETSLNPQVPGSYPFNATLVALHEHGHGLGLTHERDFPTTMNAAYPGGGPIGNPAYVHPHADDARGDRAIYGTASTQRDVASSAYRLTAPQSSQSEPIPPPQEWSVISRNTTVPVQFTVENRGTTNQSSIPVYFYLTPTRNSVHTGSFFLGSATLSLDAGRTTTGTAYLTIPSYAPTGYQYVGWIADPNNSITLESDETNNAVTHTRAALIGTNRAPSACMNAYPTFGNAPLLVSFNASCSSDPDGDPLTYTWDYGDGWSEQAGAFTEWWYMQGFYVATLTVSDPSGASSQTSVHISATCQQNGPGTGFELECPQ